MVRFASFWLYPIIAAALFARAAVSPAPVRWISLLWLVPAGVLGWSLIEYLMHRFLFHWRPRSRRLRRWLAEMHLTHHGDPHNPDRILVRPRYSLPVSLLLWSLLLAASDFFTATAAMAGVWAGFLYYESVHYRLHRSKSSGWILRRQRRLHFYHHFVDESRSYGVTSPLWDLLLGTYRTC